MNVQCQCGAGYEVPSSLAGKKAKCKKCGQSFTIPKLFASSKSNTKKNDKSKRAREDQVLAKFINRGSSLEEQVLAQHSKKNRKPDANGVRNLIIGISCLVLGAIVHYAIGRLDLMGAAQKAVYLIPVWLHVYGIYKLFLACWLLTRKSRKK